MPARSSTTCLCIAAKLGWTSASPTPATARGEQAALVGGGDGRGPVVDPELGVEVQQVGLDAGLADEQRRAASGLVGPWPS